MYRPERRATPATENVSMHTEKTRQSVRLSVFGPLSDLLGESDREVSLSFPTDAEALRGELETTYPELAGRRYQIAVDERILPASESIPAAEEVALLPPFAGG